jgi:hypothetical protein
VPLIDRRTGRLTITLAIALSLAIVVSYRAAGQTAQSSTVPPNLAPNETFTGVPWTGAPGITETVAEIMRREALAPRVDTSVPQERRPEQAEGHGPKSDNASAPAVASWPAGAASRSVAPSIGFTLTTNWLGTRLSESGALPPDSNGAVGPTQVMATSNGRFKLYSKTGTLQGLDITDLNFFAIVRGTAGVSDPHVRYDRLSGRWFISEISVENTGNHILLAVSSGSTITDQDSFTFFEFRHDAVGPTPNVDTGHFADYDTLGVDANALYIGVNEFSSSSGPFQNTSAFVVNKANLLSGTLTVTAFRGLAVGSGAGPYTPQGVDNDDPAATEGYFIGVDNQVFSQLDIRRVSNPGGTPSISGNLTVTVPATSFPIPQVAQGSTAPLDALDDRLFAAMIKRNKLTGVSSLWTAHNIRVDATGTVSGSGDRNASRWYQIDNLTGTPTLTQAGTVFTAGTNTSQMGFWIPSVAANGQGHMALGASVAASDLPASANVQSRLSSDTLGTTPQTPHTVLGVAGYNAQGGSRQRWGDFSQVVVDPEDDQTLWTFQEYADAVNSWGVRVMKLIAPPPATPASANPSSVTHGVASTDVTITGTSSSGSAFFDPGAGFPRRLTATVSGGVTVNSATFVNPTTVTINISTVGAALGPKDVTILNPDTQAQGASSLLTVISGFTDDPLTPALTVIKAVHVTELRSRIDQQRTRFGLSAFPWTDLTLSPGTTLVRAVHVAELRTALTQAYTAAGQTPPTFTDSTLTPGVTPVRAVHIAELRAAVVAIE